MTSTAATTSTTAKSGKATYVLLAREPEQPGAWFEAGRVKAGSAGEAIRSHVAAAKDAKTGTFVAIPERSWQPRTVRVEVKQTVKLDDPGTGR